MGIGQKGLRGLVTVGAFSLCEVTSCHGEKDKPVYRGGKKPMVKLTHALRIRLTEDPSKANRIAEKLIEMALDGNLEAIKLIFDRLEGKAPQSVKMEHSGTVDHKHNLTADERRDRIRELITASSAR